MSRQESGLSHAVARFSAEVDQALTTARRAARDARAESAEFRRRTEELATQAKSGKLRGLRREQITPTAEEGRAEAAKFRTDNGLPVPELPTADELLARLPNRDPAPVARPVAEHEDFSQHLVLIDVDDQIPQEEPGAEPDDEPHDEPHAGPADPRMSDAEEDFSQQRILMDATVESYRPERPEILTDTPSEPEDPR